MVAISEKPLTGQFLTLFDDSRQLRVVEIDFVFHSAFSAKLEVHRLPADINVTIAHGSQADRPVLPGVFVIAYPHECGFQKTDDGGKHLFLRESAAGKILRNAGRMAGRVWAKAIIRWYFISLRISRQRSW